MRKADRLSRRLDLKVGVENDNCNQVFIKDYWIYNLYKVVVEGPEVDVVEKIKKVRSKNKKVVRVVEEMKKEEVMNLRENEWKIEERLVLKKGKIYVSKDEELRVEIIQLYYNMLVAGHGSRWKTTELVTRNYWWLEIMKDIGKYVEGCNAYQRMKNRIEIPVGKLITNKIPEKP